MGEAFVLDSTKHRLSVKIHPPKKHEIHKHGRFGSISREVMYFYFAKYLYVPQSVCLFVY